MRYIVYLAALLSLPAFATDKPEAPRATATAAAQGGNATATGGDAAATQQQGQQQTASNDLTIGGDRNLALVNGSATSPVCPQGLVPGRRGKRGLATPLVSLSAVCVPPNEAEAAAMKVYRDHELELVRAAIDAAKAEAERDRAAAERIRVETECVACGARK